MLVPEIPLHEREYAGIPGRLEVLGQHLERHHPGPPIYVACRAELAVVSLAIDDRVGPAPRLTEKRPVANRISKRNEAVGVIRAALPVLAAPSEPTAVRADVRPESFEVPRQPVGLQLQLLAQPPGWSDRAYWQPAKSGPLYKAANLLGTHSGPRSLRSGAAGCGAARSGAGPLRQSQVLVRS